MKNFRRLSAIGFCLTFIFILNIGVVIAMIITGDHFFAAYAIGLSAYQYYLHGKLSFTKKGLQYDNQRPLKKVRGVSTVKSL